MAAKVFLEGSEQQAPFAGEQPRGRQAEGQREGRNGSRGEQLRPPLRREAHKQRQRHSKNLPMRFFL